MEQPGSGARLGHDGTLDGEVPLSCLVAVQHAFRFGSSAQRAASLASLRLFEAAGWLTFHATLVDLEKKRCLDRS